MEGVTDAVFRQLLVNIGKPELMFTEFTNVSSIFSHDHTAISQRLKLNDKEQPVIAQIWGLDPELFELSADLVANMGFAGVDLNFGCPDRSVLKQGACSALVNNRPLAKKIIEATQKGASGRIPVSLKIRLGLNQIVIEEWVEWLLQFEPQAITIHGRTAKEMSDVPMHWDEIGKAVAVRDRLKSKTLILGNGDVESLGQAKEKAKQYGLDGVMIGRGIFKDPWIFNPQESIAKKTTQQKLELLLAHVRLYHQTWGETKSWHVLKRFFKIYVSGFRGALQLRVRLMETTTLSEVESIVNQFLSI